MNPQEMNATLLAAAATLRIGGERKLALMRICAVADNRTGIATVPLADIALWTNTSLRNAITLIEDLGYMGLIHNAIDNEGFVSLQVNPAAFAEWEVAQ